MSEEVKKEDEKPDDPKEDEDKSSESRLLKELEDEAPKTFPQILHEILSNEEDSDTISWLPHGRAFLIYKKKKFASNVLPKYFKATKFTSFTRKLNRWGFTRVTRGPEMGSYYHKLFLRDDQNLCLRMSSHSSSKYQDTPGQIMPGMGMPGFGMPFMPGFMPTMQGPPASMEQQSQMINQQLQHLQWQQFQLQQMQAQQQQAQQQQQQGGPPGPPGSNGPMGGMPPSPATQGQQAAPGTERTV